MTTPLRFELVPGWEQLPPDYGHKDVCGVAVDGLGSGGATLRWTAAGRSESWIKLSGATTQARSIACWSSRMLPGQL